MLSQENSLWMASNFSSVKWNDKKDDAPHFHAEAYHIFHSSVGSNIDSQCPQTFIKNLVVRGKGHASGYWQKAQIFQKTWN